MNCASLGCPDLRRKAYTSNNVEKLMPSGAVQYINHPCGVSIENGNLAVSRIYEWFTEDLQRE